MSAVIESLNAVLPASAIHTDPHVVNLFAHDVFGKGTPALAVIRPSCTTDIQALVKVCLRTKTALITRGGGMSYTAGYLADHEQGLLLDMSSMNRIIEVNTEDAYVTVEAGVTWSMLHQTLAPLGLRTPFWGTLSGSQATVGGGLSQNGVFWGSGYHGTAGDSILGLGVVTGTGEVLLTGSNSQRNGQPFTRYFGPDMTGLFIGDCGALGIKVTATLPLIPVAGAKAFTSFAFPDAPSMMAAMADISRRSLASECFGFDPYLQGQRMKRASLAADVSQLSGVIKAGGSLKEKIISGAKVAITGRRFMDNVNWSFSAISEGRCDSEAEYQAEAICQLSARHGGEQVPDSIPRLLAANPFGPVNNMVGASGERWLPVHTLVPHSAAQATLTAIETIFTAHRDAMDRFDIETGYLITTVSQQMTLIEPVFFWPDALNVLHEHSLEPSHLAKLPRHAAAPGAWEVVNTIKAAIATLCSARGTSHFQLGRAYHYRDALRPESGRLVDALKITLDPQGIINPGVLGLDSRS